jgi:hypothetical protein
MGREMFESMVAGWQSGGARAGLGIALTQLIMLKMMRTLPVLAVIALTGCLPLPGGHSLSSRIVAAKGADELIADDGSRCSVGAKAVSEATVGLPHTCVWKSGERGAGQTPRPIPGDKPRIPKGTSAPQLR